ncbi:hypothetical protein OQX61_23540 [Pedobacter sp. PLR]|uniref:hypothetical protein n=1 Tax=Pedobacter sp. PLR TaxID=2994465 RepID=UPI00224613C9|nr:hypothetical protein [Pedobacter sp. PLR]MCX2454265.1 hypothetical protein [Pedobacter sp. PLR]
MKTIYPSGISLIALALFSCNSQKANTSAQKQDSTMNTVVDTAKKQIGGNKDEHGCLTSAGYSWSVLKKECIRPFELATKMKDLSNNNFAGYVLFSADNKQVEIFAVEFNPAIILSAADTDVYTSTDKKYKMEKDAQKHWFVTKTEDGKATSILQQE